MSDLISRQEAIDALDTGLWGVEWDKALATAMLKDLPSAEPERKTGRWIPQDHNKRHGNISTCIYFSPTCSECGHTGDFNMNYCPNCGSRMMNEQSIDDKVSDLPGEAYYNKNWKSEDGGGA